MSNNVIRHYGAIQEASDERGLSTYFVRQLVLDGKVKYIKSGVKYLINLDSLDEYLDKMEQEND